MYAICPNDQTHNAFKVLVEATLEIIVDGNGRFLRDSSLIIRKSPNRDQKWFCAICEAEAIHVENPNSLASPQQICKKYNVEFFWRDGNGLVGVRETEWGITKWFRFWHERGYEPCGISVGLTPRQWNNAHEHKNWKEYKILLNGNVDLIESFSQTNS